MYGIFYNPDEEMIDNQNNNSLPVTHTKETFQALVDAIIPRSPELAEKYGEIQYDGALDLYVDEFVVLSLNYYDIPLANPTAKILDVAAEQLILSDGNERLLNASRFPGGGAFAALAPSDRFRALTLLQQHELNNINLGIPYQDNLELAISITNALNRFTMMGYYSEWSGYGSTRLETPNQRILEYYPLSWNQVGYPGPSLGYRALRV